MSQRDRNTTSRIVYMELESGYRDDGPARVGRVTFSKSGRSLYYKGRRFERIRKGGVRGNYVDVETGEGYWISGVKQDERLRTRLTRPSSSPRSPRPERSPACPERSRRKQCDKLTTNDAGPRTPVSRLISLPSC